VPSQIQFHDLLEIMLQDKKNRNGEIRFVLLESIGKAKSDIACSENDIKSALGLLATVGKSV
jgi:3-dehydroquinate synthetase